MRCLQRRYVSDKKHASLLPRQKLHFARECSGKIGLGLDPRPDTLLENHGKKYDVPGMSKFVFHLRRGQLCSMEFCAVPVPTKLIFENELFQGLKHIPSDPWLLDALKSL